MNSAHIHLLLNHFPIVGTVIGFLLMILGFLLKNTTVKRVASGVFIFSALMAIPAFLTGEGAEDAVENLPGVKEGLSERHENIASVFIWITSILGVFAVIGLLADLLRKPFGKYLYIITLVISMGAIGIAKQLGTTGGEIRHTEIRTGALPHGGTNAIEDDD